MPDTVRPPDKSEREANAIVYGLFEKWTDSLIAEENKEEEMRQRTLFAKAFGVGDNSGLALMFTAFLGGIDAGLDLAKFLND